MDDFNKTPNIYPNLSAIPSNEQQFRLNKINEIKYYFLDKIRERELISKNLSILTVCSCHVTYAFQSESTLYSCLNVKELLARSRREI